MSEMNIVGIAGLPRSGKDTLAKQFIEAGYFGVSLGDIVREQSRQRHVDEDNPISVANMTETANYLRQQFGADVVLRKAIEAYKEAKKEASYTGLVLYSIRTPTEVDFIRTHHGRLIWVEASDDIRYARALGFSRDGEMKNIDMDTFLAHEALQWRPKLSIPKDAQMDVAYVKENATDTIENNDDFATFEKHAQQLLQDIAK